ncbi:hypothetical protein LCGC14_3151990 [marine sediment metagenome]|uniref:Uncharacterized protein n=1 Tax=marine sediment metagenome TaxID=412755 RepID=A0A0F8WHU7_9ZZZZ
MVGRCENCDGLFCSVCDEDAGKCTQCGRDYCEDCRRREETCDCSPDEDE